MKESEMNTRQRYLMKALDLFSRRGFDAVSLSDIAVAVGVSRPALYKHFKSKRDLLDVLFAMSDKGFAERMEELQVNFDEHPEKQREFSSLTVDQIVDRTRELFLHTAFDDVPRQFRQLMTVEQFHMPEVAEKYNYRYVERQYEEYEALFRMLMEEGKMRKADPETLAVTFMSPFIVMLGVCDREPEKKDEALELIEKHVREFCENYFLA